MNVFHRAAEIASGRDEPTWRCLMIAGGHKSFRNVIPLLRDVIPPFSICENRGHRVMFLLMLAAMRDAGDL